VIATNESEPEFAEVREALRLLIDLSDRLLSQLDHPLAQTAPPELAAIGAAADESALPAVLAEAARRIGLDRRLPPAFGQLRDHPELADTLACWLAHDREVRSTARSLHVHANTVRYRLSRVEKILDRSLSETPVLTALYLTALAFPQTLGLPGATDARPPGPAQR
jgi:hypothetical protein